MDYFHPAVRIDFDKSTEGIRATNLNFNLRAVKKVDGIISDDDIQRSEPEDEVKQVAVKLFIENHSIVFKDINQSIRRREINNLSNIVSEYF